MSTLDKAALILRAFSSQQPEWGSRALAVQLGLPRATAQFYLSGLARAGFLRRTPAGQYRLSWQLAEYGAQLTLGLPWFPRARNALAEVAQATAGLGFLCVLEEDRVICINRALGDPGADHAQVQTDVTLPANATAAGKLLYAHAALPVPEFARYTASTITTPDEWHGALARVRQDGYAHAIEEWVPGQCAVGVPLWWDGAVVAAFGVQLPTARFLARERRVLARVQQAARPFAPPA
ncbi:IclR family transcriptional regulator [Deinococcus sonorensis]|uniref:IclR family transcriptional regulator n=2 Tax=Deinococcus sonorensis TaxID=309891 RepID=A0AAU7U4G7_9DEIO